MKKRQKSRLPSPGSASTMSDFDINSDDELPSDSELNDSELDDSVVDTEGEVDEEDGDENESGDDDVDADVMDAFDNLSEDMDKGDHKKRKGKRREEEADYEMSGRSRWAGKPEEEDGEQVEVGRLPIKLPSGEVQQVEGTTKIELPASKKRKAKPEPVEEEEEEEGEDEEDQEGAAARMATTKGRFGRMGVAEIVGHEGWKNARKLEAAKEQIAALGAEILAGGELVDTVCQVLAYRVCLAEVADSHSYPSFHLLPPDCHLPKFFHTAHRAQLRSRSLPPITIGSLQGSRPWLPDPSADRSGGGGEGAR